MLLQYSNIPELLFLQEFNYLRKLFIGPSAFALYFKYYLTVVIGVNYDYVLMTRQKSLPSTSSYR